MHAVRVWLSLTLLVAGAAISRAQDAQPVAPTGTIRGTVYDSLMGGRLPGAQVWVVGTTLATHTDRSGRFQLNDVPSGRAVFAFSHPDLDSIGLSSHARRIEVQPSRTTAVSLDVASRATLFRVACDIAGENWSDSGVVFGSVEDPGTRVRLAGARVVVSWVVAHADPAWGMQVSRPAVVATTDSLGNYYACAIPRDYVVTVVAQAGRFASGVTELLLGPRGVARRDLGVSRDSLSLAADSTGARRGRATIIGRVVNEHGQAVRDVRATVDDATGEAATSENGVFVLPGLPAGSQTVMVRRIGYSAARLPVLLRDDDTVHLEFAVRSLTVMDTIRVVGNPGPNHFLLEELDARIRNRSGFILTGENLQGATQMRSVLQLLPGLMIGGSALDFTATQRLGMSGYQAIVIYIDGIRAEPALLNSYRPEQLMAVEWYARGVFAPSRYATTSRVGVLLVWSRFFK